MNVVPFCLGFLIKLFFFLQLSFLFSITKLFDVLLIHFDIFFFINSFETSFSVRFSSVCLCGGRFAAFHFSTSISVESY